MSSDFSIKPVGTPVATPMVQPASPAAAEAVATELPAHQSVAAADAAPRMRNDTQSAGGNTSKHVILDRDAASVVYQVVDNRTSLVVKQFPDEGMLRRRAYARALEQAREDAHALRIDRKI
jgi:uncharacterized FlaG/YvyC family protein